jgi:ABC-2 type transport system ATP-binding protein
MVINQKINFFKDFYADFDKDKATRMLLDLNVPLDAKLRTLSKGTKEKVQLVLVMSRNASLYLLDEPIAGVDPAARDFILRTIVSNVNPESTVLISTHLISDVEPILDEFIFIRDGSLLMYNSVANAKEKYGKSIDALFRDVFAYNGGVTR